MNPSDARPRPETGVDPDRPIPDGTAHAGLVEHLRAHSVREGEFVLKSGKTSNWFCDAKQTTCRPDGMLLVADAALSILPDDVTAIGGLTMGADAVAFGVAAIAATRGRQLRVVQRAQGGQGPRRRRPRRRRARARRRGGHRRGRRHPWRVDARGGRRRRRRGRRRPPSCCCRWSIAGGTVTAMAADAGLPVVAAGDRPRAGLSLRGSELSGARRGHGRPVAMRATPATASMRSSA